MFFDDGGAGRQMLFLGNLIEHAPAVVVASRASRSKRCAMAQAVPRPFRAGAGLPADPAAASAGSSVRKPPLAGASGKGMMGIVRRSAIL